MKRYPTIILVLLAILFAQCENMDDNYSDYLNNVKQYSPRVTNLTVQSGLKEATLSWKNPQGNIAVKNAILLQDSMIVLDGLTEIYKLKNLEIKGYAVSVFTVDKFGNYSVPAQTTLFPNGE